MGVFVLNFKAEFATAVSGGFKLQTLRKNRKDGKRPGPGDRVKLYTGLRTRFTKLLLEAEVVRCRAVRIDFSGFGQLIIDGELMTLEERTASARADGFSCWDGMCAWFRRQYCEEDSFEGFCVEWKA